MVKKFSVVVGGGGWVVVLKATLVFIFGPNLKTRTLAQAEQYLAGLYAIVFSLGLESKILLR